MRRCNRCDKEKPDSEFPTRSDGRTRGPCKQCALEYASEWRHKNIDKVRKYTRRHHDSHKESIRAGARKHYYENREREIARAYEYRKKNPERVAVYQKNRLALIKGSVGKHTYREWKMICDMYGNVCLRCGESKKLTEDHVMPISLGGSNHISNIQPMCGSCNSSKGKKNIDYRPNYYWADWT